MLMTPVLLGQFRLFYDVRPEAGTHGGKPIGVVFWAHASAEVAERLAQGVTRLRPQDWKSGAVRRRHAGGVLPARRDGHGPEGEGVPGAGAEGAGARRRAARGEGGVMWNSDFSQVGGSIENRLAQFQKDEEMAAFADIAGWREELAELRSGPAYKKMYPHTIRDPKNDPLVPLSTIFDFVETILMHPSTRNALRSLSVWHKANPPEIKMLDPENDPTFPHEASNLIFDFAMWFMLKTGRGPRYEAYLTGLGLATLVVNAEIATARCPQAIQYLKQRAAFSIDFEEMGTHTIFLINVDRL